MSTKLVIVVNGQSMIEYDRNTRLPGHQRQFLDKMDSDMDIGVTINGKHIDQPDLKVRAQYIAMHLVQSILKEDDAMIAATCAYLATRIPDLKQVQANEQGENISFDLIFTDEQKNQVAVQFDPGLNTKH
ncbi:hypothetical protein MNBD_GAMMA21-964 [hydrothermal vent metagenome]|uniref:Uncharacterized protein n=1 Tax=hydrothermal vent metagenome TaxID=652676 RepID=A0A3B0ZIR2_9ZZZZ